jgi:phosphomannomutase
MTTDNQKLERVRQWLERDTLDRSRVAPMFVKLVRILTGAEEPEVWNPAIDVSHRFLDVIERELTLDLQWPHAESAKLFSMLLTILAEAGQYRHETYSGDADRRRLIDTELLPQMGELREHTVSVAKRYLRQPVFSSLETDIKLEIFPLLESMGDTSGKNSKFARDRYMPFRVIQVGNVAERLYSFRVRTADPRLLGGEGTYGLLREIYDRKYARFGTSGVRGRWGLDFTEVRAKRVVQAICDFLKDSDVPAHVGAEDLLGKRIVIGYDSRRNARLVAEWAAQVCLANGFKVDFATRDLPTPALVYYLTDYLDPDQVAGLINCTASHNPPEWQGTKFNPRHGYPAPTSLTDFIAARANQLQLLDECAPVADLSRAEERGDVRGFDPIVNYTNWVLDNGKGNQRILIDPDRIRNHFRDGLVVVDEMHGSSRGFLTRLLGEIGVRYKVIHAERDPNLPGLDYANPEEPFIGTLEATVRELDDAVLGLGMDTDADRFGVVDGDGIYYRPNQVLPMLVRYLGIDRELTGRVIATQTGSPLIEKLAEKRAEKLAKKLAEELAEKRAGGLPENLVEELAEKRAKEIEQNHPELNVVPAFVSHPFYHRRVGDRKERVYKYTFMVPVGIKYIEEQRRTDRGYRFYKELPENWRDIILIGGEESSGLTTRGHVTDKDGVWANLLIMDMIAYYGKPMSQIWEDTVAVAGWKSFGGRELDAEPSNTGRADVDAVLEAKEALINDFLDRFEGQAPGEGTFAGLPVIYAGGIRYDFVELQLRDAQGGTQHYLRVRASGTEPINRIYVESSDPEIARRLMETALGRLEELSAAEIQKAHSEWRLAEILSTTRLSDSLTQVTRSAVAAHKDWSMQGLISRLERMLPTVERRNQRAIGDWIAALGGGG